MGSLNPLRFPFSQWQMTNCKMENGKCLRLRYNARSVSASGSEALPAFIFCGELMFERYTEKARRVIFFARYEASQFGAPAIEPEHLLLGLMREDKSLTARFLARAQTSLEAIRKEIEGRAPLREKISTSVELPLAPETKRVLAYAHEESDRLQHRHIGTEHLLLGLLREERSMCRCCSRSLSSCAYARTRLVSGASGNSTEVEIFSRKGARPSISLRMASSEVCARARKRAVRDLSSRMRPSRRCSGSMAGAPNWEASYRAKKMTLRAFSVYRSNIRKITDRPMKTFRVAFRARPAKPGVAPG